MFSSTFLFALVSSLPILAASSAMLMLNPLGAQEPFTTNPTTPSPFDDVKVPVTLGVMSRCPDAQLCEAVFDQVLKKVRDKVEFSLTFVGAVNASEPDFGVTCMHGPSECAGNVQQLCAQKYTPLETWWEFVMCQNYQSRDRIGNADVALKCARASGIDWETSGVGRCAGLDGSGRAEEGVGMLRESVVRTRALGVTKSCTVIINGEQVCIHDGTWQKCENGHAARDFIRQINNEYQKLNGLALVDEEALTLDDLI
ncbi:uncharacterized protein STEHIDRAFT_81113 [Stereum hirsutum FP-91666 SS1]|uniref:uncharacterized protein n=1 Tax=Stereum hirsutum (strain FP-91666) TaxID=721885 RepID=UPI000444A8AD|nr:uncharacterized protein STEHIDRAFT_81113 [Stereum hirsutum FP-91666 SS1]EIM85632.1 hypothetical protein STEHIDRAFT_81113 [Stereum hirsutum FP-91666 SS1]